MTRAEITHIKFNRQHYKFCNETYHIWAFKVITGYHGDTTAILPNNVDKAPVLPQDLFADVCLCCTLPTVLLFHVWFTSRLPDVFGFDNLLSREFAIFSAETINTHSHHAEGEGHTTAFENLK